MRARYPDHTGQVVRDGLSIAFEVYENSGPTIVLFPTWSLVNSRHWKAQIPYLARYRQLRDRFAVPYLDHIVALSSFAWDGPEASRLMRCLGEIADAECELLASRQLILA